MGLPKPRSPSLAAPRLLTAPGPNSFSTLPHRSSPSEAQNKGKRKQEVLPRSHSWDNATCRVALAEKQPDRRQPVEGSGDLEKSVAEPRRPERTARYQAASLVRAVVGLPMGRQ